MGSTTPKRAWATLLTRASYLPGVLTLAYTLKKHATHYPLIVLVTPSLPKSSVRALEIESRHNPLLVVHPVEPLLPPAHHKTTLIASRFEDTWTKLRVFSLIKYDAIVFLDADITIFRNPDSAFDTPLPSSSHLAANHACVCNLDHDSWAPDSWRSENCAYTPLSHPSALTCPTPVPHSSDPHAKHTHTLLNSGMFLFYPSTSLWGDMLHSFNTSPHLSSYKFPDQDFLADFFHDRWVSMGWQYNALKTMRYWHENIWWDGEVRALHYIVDKPWERRIASDGVAGHLGRDGITHGWWWDIWKEWRTERSAEEELLRIVDVLVAGPLDREADRRQCEENRKERLPIPVPPHPGMVESAIQQKSDMHGQGFET